jgi:hypothetical protein
MVRLWQLRDRAWSAELVLVPLPPARAIRCAISNFQETRFMDSGGEWIMGSCVNLEKPWRGIPKLAKMLASVLRECIACEPSLEY